MLHDSPNLYSKLDQLHDKVLLCHCANHEPCHGDILINAWDKKFLDTEEMELEQEPAGTEELFRATELRTTVEEPESPSEDEPGQAKRGFWMERPRPPYDDRGRDQGERTP